MVINHNRSLSREKVCVSLSLSALQHSCKGKPQQIFKCLGKKHYTEAWIYWRKNIITTLYLSIAADSRLEVRMESSCPKYCSNGANICIILGSMSFLQWKYCQPFKSPKTLPITLINRPLHAGRKMEFKLTFKKADACHYFSIHCGIFQSPSKLQKDIVTAN